jgi:hypothetical protein
MAVFSAFPRKHSEAAHLKGLSDSQAKAPAHHVGQGFQAFWIGTAAPLTFDFSPAAQSHLENPILYGL